MWRRSLVEAFGAMMLTACVIGSGIMGERLAAGIAAIALLANALATVAVLAALIATFAPVSGAHFNPVVSAVAWLRGQMDSRTLAAFATAQFCGCCLGAMLANLMFELPLVQASTHARSGAAQWLSEAVATLGLVVIAFRAGSFNEAAWRVSLWIGAAYWFTASTSFANPAITVGRALSDTFAGIQPQDVPGFIVAQVIGGALGLVMLRMLAERRMAL